MISLKKLTILNRQLHGTNKNDANTVFGFISHIGPGSH